MAFITPSESIFHDSYLFAHDLNLFTLLGNLFTFLNNQIIYQTTLQNQWVSSLPYPLCYLCCLEWFSKLRDSCFSAESNLPWFQISPCSSVQRPLVPYWEYKLEGFVSLWLPCPGRSQGCNLPGACQSQAPVGSLRVLVSIKSAIIHRSWGEPAGERTPQWEESQHSATLNVLESCGSPLRPRATLGNRT